MEFKVGQTWVICRVKEDKIDFTKEHLKLLGRQLIIEQIYNNGIMFEGVFGIDFVSRGQIIDIDDIKLLSEYTAETISKILE